MDKATLRRQLLSIRRRLPLDAQREDALAQQVTQLLTEQAPRCVAFYWPIAGEYDLRATLTAWLAAAPDRHAALPVICAADAPLAFHAWQADMPMQVGPHQIPIPARALPVHPDLLLIPCVGFDTERYRLGYGGGFYDRTLATLIPRPYTVGIAFEATRVARLPRHSHDIPLDAMLSEARRY